MLSLVGTTEVTGNASVVFSVEGVDGPTLDDVFVDWESFVLEGASVGVAFNALVHGCRLSQ